MREGCWADIKYQYNEYYNEAIIPAMELIYEHYRNNGYIGRAPWDIYLKAVEMLRDAGL